MARATRSSTQHQDKEKDKLASDTTALPPSKTKTTTKKRKRNSGPDNDVQPATKQLRIDPTIKDEGSQEPEDTLTKLPQLQDAGDVPIDSANAQKILDILEMIDNQGLLDRVFPLPAESLTSTAPQKTLASSYSFRTLLKESSQHPLCVLRSAVQHLLPISSQPRSRPSVPAAQQLRFCNLALFLLDQASFHSVPIPLDLESIISSSELIDNGDDSKPSPSPTTDTSSPPRQRKYALMQRLPTGDWWTSLNSDHVADTRKLQELTTGHAELVAIFPSLSTSKTDPSSSAETPASPVSLGSYSSKKPAGPKAKLPTPRRVGCGSFLDYGHYASFAPNFDQSGVEVGRRKLGEVLWGKEERKRMRDAERAVIVDVREDVVMDHSRGTEEVRELSVGEKAHVKLKEKQKLDDDIDGSLDGLLPPEEISMIKSALGSLEIENAVHELLERNRRALERLEELQVLRWSRENGGSSDVEVGSEEWDTAQGILDSLAILASLRPRSSSDTSAPQLIPPGSVLHKLYRTLPLGTSQGWHGTLPSSRSTALRDDSTLHVKAGATIPNPAVANPATSLAASTGTSLGATTPASLYPGYAFPNYTAQQYRAAYTYKPGQAPYYPTTYAPQAQGQPQGQAGATTYYPNQNYSASGQQQQYSYGSWYNYQPPAASTGSGRGTPQPSSALTTPTMATNYAGFFNNQVPAGQRAVANTVLTSKNLGAGTYTATATTGYTQPTLPPLLRNAAATSGILQPGTSAGGYQQPSSYGTYQQPATPAK